MATTVSLVLGSGGARGYAHIGVIEELQRRGYEITCIAGSSMGALVGGVYAAGCLHEYKDWVTSLGKMDIFRLLDLALTRGTIRGERLFTRIREIVGDPLIEDLPLSYTAVATDIFRQKEVWFQRGSLQAAMRASISVPGFFTPVVSGDKVLVDGGVLNPLPIIPTVAAHADLIIAVNLNAKDAELGRPKIVAEEVVDRSGFSDVWRSANGRGAKAAGKTRLGPRIGGRIDVLLDSVEVMQASLSQYKIAGYPPDLVVEIPSDLCSFYEFHRAAEVIEVGRQIAREQLDALENGGAG
ncbi:patatin-like phospholipase family protein [Marinobacterium jannaschii]|uniref:patatin-like phospholipase family protein n=1 Tax=Marinobacterium jannaschii TaxID=64970 RepID=UPI00048A28D1|nr:patatin-like phospholipase family protein [Marinobacterium jannaschii]